LAIGIGSAPQKSAPSTYPPVWATLKRSCVPCHQGKTAPAGIRIDLLATEAAAKKQTALWSRIGKAVASKAMPPAGVDQPKASERAAIVAWIKANVKNADCDVKEPGRVTMRRLNRAEYANTVRDLFGMEFNVTDDFPSDDVGYGFDNIGDVLSISPLLMEKYLDAAERVTSQAIYVPPPRTTRYDADSFTSDRNVSTDGGAIGMNINAEATVAHDFKTPGEYRLRIRAFSTPAGDQPAKMAVSLDGKTIASFDVTATRKSPADYETPIRVQSGKHRLGVAFTNDFYDPQNPDPNRRDRNLYVLGLEVVNPPVEPAALPPAHRALIPVVPPPDQQESEAARTLARFAARAYRRPATPSETSRLAAIYGSARKNGAGYEEGVRLALTACLVSPNFLFRVEPDPKGVGTRPLNSYEVATRLSYFLWSSMPDDALFARAAGGDLSKPELIRREVARMLADPKARALTENFAGQWLQLRKLSGLTRDAKLFPEFGDGLRSAMIEETERFFAHVVAEDRPITDFIAADYAFVNPALAKLYGLPPLAGDGFRMVKVAGTGRGGLLTQASILTVTSNPTRTSPVKRGKWILEEILGTPPPPPPPGIVALTEGPTALTGKTLRQRMEQHRKDPSCAVCHAKMDALGLAFENFDAVGKRRATDDGFPIDASGTLPSGEKFNGAAELQRLLLKDKDRFAQTLAEKLMIYALGRGLTLSDDCAVEKIVAQCRSNGYRFSSLILGVATSEPFRYRNGAAK